jgi:predicted nucleotidyltransferase
MDSMDILEKAIKQSNLLNKYMLERIGVFGSFARGEPANEYANPIVLHRALKDMKYVSA